MKKIVLAGLIWMLIWAVSCEKESGDEGEGGGSHNTGKNCLSCHSNFKLAGSVYNKSLSSGLSGAKIKVSTQANGAGTVLATLTSDSNGNFHTGSSINFGTGVFVTVEGSSGTVKNMSSSITSGACNSCHGTSTSKMWAE
jgi:hypothetical protein